MTPIAAQAVRSDLEDRRERLRHAIETVGPSADFVRLLDQVDAALDRVGHPSFDECVVCHEHMVEVLPLNGEVHWIQLPADVREQCRVLLAEPLVRLVRCPATGGDDDER